MNWRLSKQAFEKGKSTGNRKAMKKIIASGEVPGLLAYDADTPVAWCSVAPREVFPRMEKAPTLKRVDDQPVWSITCFFIAKGYRRRGLSVALLEAAIDLVRKYGGKIIEGYPYEVKKGALPLPGAFVWTGLVPAFKKAGFKIAKRRSKSRPIMRYVIE
ncbi:MAG: GNAT family N-acetyltransferase [candidate division Zixibacteria bacterium]|nr:GNAT family N-acetyltransferase [candidate division Zixibacteria bacterium]